MQNVTTKKFSEMCSVSDANIRMLISRRTIEAVKDEFGNYLIDVDIPKNAEYLQKKKQAAQHNGNTQGNIMEDVTQLDNGQVPQELLVILSETNKKLLESSDLFIKAGKYEQIESNIKEKENDVQEWKAKFFELQQEKEKLLVRVTQLESNVAQLEKELAEAKQKTFFGFKLK